MLPPLPTPVAEPEPFVRKELPDLPRQQLPPLVRKRLPPDYPRFVNCDAIAKLREKDIPKETGPPRIR